MNPDLPQWPTPAPPAGEPNGQWAGPAVIPAPTRPTPADRTAALVHAVPPDHLVIVIAPADAASNQAAFDGFVRDLLAHIRPDLRDRIVVLANVQAIGGRPVVLTTGSPT